MLRGVTGARRTTGMGEREGFRLVARVASIAIYAYRSSIAKLKRGAVKFAGASFARMDRIRGE